MASKQLPADRDIKHFASPSLVLGGLWTGQRPTLHFILGSTMKGPSYQIKRVRIKEKGGKIPTMNSMIAESAKKTTPLSPRFT
ncbi:hypothetical protein A2U01_0018511, partial [Trifolium medium]|nr:hypothetical protein [Trifolium medium]